MPPHFKSAQQAGHVKPANNNHNSSDDGSSSNKRAAFVENLFPDKFGKQVSLPQQQQQQQKGGGMMRQQQQKPQRQQQQQERSWFHMPGKTENGVPVIIPRMGVPVPMPKITAPTRRERSLSSGKHNNHNKNAPSNSASSSSAVRHITWDREVVKKIHPTVAISRNDKPKFWFQEALEETADVEFVKLAVGVVAIIDITGPTKIRLLSWEHEESGATCGRITLYIGPMPPHPRRPDPSTMVAIATINPLANSMPLDINLPPGSYMIEGRYGNPKLAQTLKQNKQKKAKSGGGDDDSDDDDEDSGKPKLLLLLETHGQTFGLR